jgi:agmatine deiminase
MVAAASYLNFVIVNDLLLAPRYGLPSDEAALAAFQTAFPQKKIILLNPIALNWGGGGMHCITANEPY